MPHDRTDRRAEEALNRPENRVALFLDYENIRHSLEHHFEPAPSPQIVAEKLALEDSEVSPVSFRPPVRPVKLKELAGLGGNDK